ncbi:acyl carrier protein [Lactococcus lactis subsp. lactis]|jgi:Acyl carrier protein|uniref:acyl carrier protein n=1 Tax=Lactococcus lactis TaxID=1358 RepID=UPI00223B96ED|nr:phosphopantetheine-binding protein [Lactococcus lactis]MCT0016552.1 acyl carrier protein [Lactococcus lactis subsp. lactis]
MITELDERLKKIIILAADNVKVDNISKSTNLINDLSFDSVNFMQLIIGIEDEFDIELDDTDLQQDNLSSYDYLKNIISLKSENL